ncbi:MAG: hypothetical protein C4527_14330 [Candidatus Omnitrophota bacterium]|jgi:GTP-binding protein EngB required for normal cell division|nr:MAG: hypothetical protein C4527_14330 [Candidatus Omnitrophota bacterium]
MNIQTLRTQLDQLNQELAQLTGLASPPLSFQAGTAEEDSLFLYGIVGGKDVGKTSLINQLAGARISIDTDILDEGTKIAVAYCHKNDLADLRKRLAMDMKEHLNFISHERNELRNVVLIDFPDFDSRFITHRDDVQRLSKYLQSIVWVVSPRKYGDHEFLDQLTAVAQSSENYYVALNKIDQLEQRADLNTVRKEVREYLTRECVKRHVPPPQPDRLLLISALSPDKYDFPILHNRLIRIHSPEEIAKAKIKNLTAEFEKNLSRIDEHYSLTAKIEMVDKALDLIRTRIGDEFSDDYCETVCRRVLTLEQRRQRIGGELFSRRVEGWPVLRSLFYPLAGVVSVLSGRFASSHTQKETPDLSQELLRFQNRSAAARMQDIRDCIEDRFPLLAQEFGEMRDYAELLDPVCRELVRDHEDRVTERLAQGITAPGPARKFMAYFPLIWFPLLQPLLYQLIRHEESWFSFASFFDLIGILISLISASALLVNFCFLLIFYTVWLILLYSRGARSALKEGQEEFRNSWYEQFLPWLAEVLSHPLQELRSKLAEKSDRLQRIEQELKTEMDHGNRMKKQAITRI